MTLLSQLPKDLTNQQLPGRSEWVCLRMTHTLVKLSVASAGHGWVITAVHFGDVVALYVGYLVHGQVSGKGHLTEDRSRTTGHFALMEGVQNVKSNI